MTSKRNLKRDVEQLSEESVTSDAGLYVCTLTQSYDTREEAPRPELLVPATHGDGYKTATPNVHPDEFPSRILFLSQAVVDTWEYNEDEDGTTVPVSALWDSLSEAQLRKERQIREKEGETIPALLEAYATE